MQADTGGVGFMSFLQMMVALASSSSCSSSSSENRTNSTALVTKAEARSKSRRARLRWRSLYIVRAKSKTLLLSCASQGDRASPILTDPCLNDSRPSGTRDKEMEGPLQPFAVVEANSSRPITTPAGAAAAGLRAPQRLAG